MRAWLLEHWVALVALVVAIYAAGISSFNTYLNWRTHRRKLKVKLAWTWFSFGNSKAKASDDLLGVDVKNEGGPTEIVDVVFQINGKRYQEKRPDPVELKFHESHTFHQHPGSLAVVLHKVGIKGTVSLSAVIREKAGKEWTTNSLTVDLDEYRAEYERKMHELGKKAKESFERMAAEEGSQVKARRQQPESAVKEGW